MCGFAGEFVFNGRADIGLAKSMAESLAHRGPDESGEFLSPDGQCAMAFRRLSIIDIENSHQPMASPDQNIAMVFNGEIYNHRQLRDQLKDKWNFKTAGDSEVLLASFATDNTNAFEKLNGMFAAVFYNSQTQTLNLVRDRLGQKPLFYSILTDRIIFASELKAILKHPKITKKPDFININSFILIGYINTPKTGYDNIHKLPPVCRACISPDKPIEITKYWQPTAAKIELPTDQTELENFIREKIIASVGKRMISDVPLGALLSGGIDSAIITAAMCEHRPASEVRTFTASFEDSQYNEGSDAKRTADHFGTNHTELKISPNPKGIIDWVVDTYDEPFADSSAIPTFLICQAARKHVTVALGGDGGDETFGGYDRYRAMHLAQYMKPTKYFAFIAAGTIANILAPDNERNKFRRLARFSKILPWPAAVQYFMIRNLFGPMEMLKLMNPDFLADNDIYVDDPAEWFYNLFEQGGYEEAALNAQLHDINTYLPDDILVKTDIASMATSLELRAPFLDHELVEIGLALPLEQKLNNKHGKLILRKAFGQILPKEVFIKPKRGFGVPLASWLRNELREEVLQTLTDSKFQDMGLFNPPALAALINEHLKKQADHSHRIWAITILARWLVKNF